MKILLQIGVVFGICLVGQTISVFIPIAIPGSVISMVLLFLLLFFKLLKIDHIRQKADFLLKNMAFFFIPAGIGIIADFASIQDVILPLLAVVVLTTLLTFGTTALVVQVVITAQNRVTRRRLRRKRRAALGSSTASKKTRRRKSKDTPADPGIREDEDHE